MSLNKTAISSLLCTFVTDLVGQLCIIAEQPNAPRPKAPTAYGTVHLFNSLGFGWDAVAHANQADPAVDLIETIQGNRMLSFSFNFYRGEAFDVAEKFRTLLFSEYSAEFLKSSGLGLSARSAVRDLSTEISKNWEERAQLDVDFHVINVETLITRSIQSAEIEANFQSSGLSASETITIN